MNLPILSIENQIAKCQELPNISCASFQMIAENSKSLLIFALGVIVGLFTAILIYGTIYLLINKGLKALT